MSKETYDSVERDLPLICTAFVMKGSSKSVADSVCRSSTLSQGNVRIKRPRKDLFSAECMERDLVSGMSIDMYIN